MKIQLVWVLDTYRIYFELILDTIRENLGSMHQTLQHSGFNEQTQTPQVAIVSGGVESVLTSPSPPGKYFIAIKKEI